MFVTGPEDSQAIGQHRLPLMSHPVAWAAICTFLLCALAGSASTVLFTQGPYDGIVPLDAGVRLLNGSFPSVDYPSPIGFLYALLHAAAMWLGGIDARAIWWANILVTILCFAGLVPISDGLPKGTRFLILATVGAMLLLPLNIDSFPPDYRYVANYNHWGWALVGIVTTWTLHPGRMRAIHHIISGLALAAIFYLKLSIFAGAMPLMALGLAAGRRPGEYLLPLGILTLALLLGLWHGLLPAYLSDNIAVLRATDPIRAYKLLWQIVTPFNVPVTVILIMLFYRLRLRDRMLVTAIAAWLLLNIIGLQNNYKFIPVIGWPLLLVLPSLPAPYRWPFSVILAQTILLVAVAALGFGLQTTVARVMAATPLGAPGSLGAHIELSTVGGSEDWRADPQGNTILDTDQNLHTSIDLSQPLIAEHPGRFFTLEFANVALLSFPAAEPAGSGTLWQDFGRNFSARSYVTPQQLFQQAEFILVPKRYRSASVRELVHLYQPWLDKCAAIIAGNELWLLYSLGSGSSQECAAQPLASRYYWPPS
jgi:hypothetical protein